MSDIILTYHVKVPADSPLVCDVPGETTMDLMDWMMDKQREPGHYCTWTHNRPVPEDGQLQMSFQNKDDAMYFKLRWGGV
jgi:hypothetical protein